jgi:hypothetical protein
MVRTPATDAFHSRHPECMTDISFVVTDEVLKQRRIMLITSRIQILDSKLTAVYLHSNPFLEQQPHSALYNGHVFLFLRTLKLVAKRGDH